MFINWDYLYEQAGIKEFIYFVSSPSIQEALFPIKLVFIFFTIFFFCAAMWFYLNSSYIQYRFLQNVTGFFSKEAQTLKSISKSWKKIKKRAEGGSEAELKLAIIESDDFLLQSLQDMDYKGETFEELLKSASQKLPDAREVLEAHRVRDAIIYEPDYKLDIERAKRMITVYEKTIKAISAG